MAYLRVQRDSSARDGNTDEQISWTSEAGSRSVRTETECEDLERRDEEEMKRGRKPRERDRERERIEKVG